MTRVAAAGDVFSCARRAPQTLRRRCGCGVSSSAHHTCARGFDGVVRCWGRNNARQLGDGTTSARLSPSWVANNAGSVATGLSYTCVVSGVGAVQCAGGGTGASPLIGNGTGQSSGVFATTSISNVRRVRTGGINHVCAERRDGTVWCWGTNTNGVMGLGTSGGAVNSPVLTPF